MRPTAPECHKLDLPYLNQSRDDQQPTARAPGSGPPATRQRTAPARAIITPRKTHASPAHLNHRTGAARARRLRLCCRDALAQRAQAALQVGFLGGAALQLGARRGGLLPAGAFRVRGIFLCLDLQLG
jgi:hypothetical protein